MPDVPVVSTDGVINFEIQDVCAQDGVSFCGSNDTKDTPRDDMGWNLPRPCIVVTLCGWTPKSDAEIAKEKRRKTKVERDRLRMSPNEFALQYAEILPLTPDDFAAMWSQEK